MMTTSRRNRKVISDKSPYFLWLCDQIGIGASDRGRRKLAVFLLHQDFESQIPNDTNRAADGIELRDRWSLDHNIDAPCTVLEMMIALAYRMDDNISRPGARPNAEPWFWEMVDNLGLLEYTGQLDLDRDIRFENESNIDVFLSREYHRNGEGGMFPLRHPEQDQRKVELWYQMNAYCMENYY